MVRTDISRMAGQRRKIFLNLQIVHMERGRGRSASVGSGICPFNTLSSSPPPMSFPGWDICLTVSLTLHINFGQFPRVKAWVISPRSRRQFKNDVNSVRVMRSLPKRAHSPDPTATTRQMRRRLFEQSSIHPCTAFELPLLTTARRWIKGVANSAVLRCGVRRGPLGVRHGVGQKG